MTTTPTTIAPTTIAPTTTAPTTTDPATAEPADPATLDPARTTRVLRFTALGGFAVLAVLLVCTAFLVLLDGVQGDGVGGGFTEAAFWMFPVGAVLGLVALAAPRALLRTRPRRNLVIAQYAFGAAGVLLQLMD